MNIKHFLRTHLIIMLASAVVISCSDGDDDAPPPTVDCNATGPSISLTATETACGQDDGQIEVDVTGGTGNLDVTISPQPIGFSFDNNTFTAMEPGTYTVEVTDDDNCTTSETVTVGFMTANLSYADDIDPIVQSKCAISGCHDGTQPDFTVFENFQARANNQPGGVRQRVKTGDMPRSGSLTGEEISMILCWIDEGAQNN